MGKVTYYNRNINPYPTDILKTMNDELIVLIENNDTSPLALQYVSDLRQLLEVADREILTSVLHDN